MSVEIVNANMGLPVEVYKRGLADIDAVSSLLKSNPLTIEKVNALKSKLISITVKEEYENTRLPHLLYSVKIRVLNVPLDQVTQDKIEDAIAFVEHFKSSFASGSCPDNGKLITACKESRFEDAEKLITEFGIPMNHLVINVEKKYSVNILGWACLLGDVEWAKWAIKFIDPDFGIPRHIADAHFKEGYKDIMAQVEAILPPLICVLYGTSPEKEKKELIELLTNNGANPLKRMIAPHQNKWWLFDFPCFLDRSDAPQMLHTFFKALENMDDAYSDNSKKRSIIDAMLEQVNTMETVKEDQLCYINNFSHDETLFNPVKAGPYIATVFKCCVVALLHGVSLPDDAAGEYSIKHLLFREFVIKDKSHNLYSINSIVMRVQNIVSSQIEVLDAEERVMILRDLNKEIKEISSTGLLPAVTTLIVAQYMAEKFMYNRQVHIRLKVAELCSTYFFES